MANSFCASITFSRDFTPESFAELERYNLEYERREFRYADSNRVIADATKAVFASWFPAPLGPLVDTAIYALLDEPVLDAFGYPHPSPATRRCVEGGLRLRARVVRHLPRRRRPRLVTAVRHRSYPHGYRLAHLGAAVHGDGGTVVVPD